MSHDIAPDVIKFDTEGHELPGLMGSERVLDRYHPCIILEVGHADATECSPARFLLERGYIPYGILADHLAQVSLDTIRLAPPGSNFLFLFPAGG